MILVLLVHLPLFVFLGLNRRRVVSEENGALLLPGLDDVGLLPVLHDVGERELQVLVNRLERIL